MYTYSNKLPEAKLLNEILSVDESSPTGLTWNVNRGGRAKAGTTAGARSTGIRSYGRAHTKINGTFYLNSRLIFKMITGKDPEGVIDHIDGDCTNDKFSNFQDITQRENLRKKAGEVITS